MNALHRNELPNEKTAPRAGRVARVAGIWVARALVQALLVSCAIAADPALAAVEAAARALIGVD